MCCFHEQNWSKHGSFQTHNLGNKNGCHNTSIYIPFTNFHHGYEITNKHIRQLGKFEQGIEYLQEWHKNIQPQKHCYISQQTQVILSRNYGVCIKCHFHEESVIFKQHTFDKINCGYLLNFDVSQYFVALISMIFSNLVTPNVSWGYYWNKYIDIAKDAKSRCERVYTIK